MELKYKCLSVPISDQHANKDTQNKKAALASQLMYIQVEAT